MKQLITLFAAIFISNVTMASHISGGEITLQHLEGNYYLLTLKKLADCANGVPMMAEPIFIGMFTMNHNLVDTFKIDHVSTIDTVWLSDTGAYCMRIGVYEKIINLDPWFFNDTAGYYFSYEKCCRNSNITNLYYINGPPSEIGMTFYMSTVPSFNNSTPQFQHDSLYILGLGRDYNLSLNVLEADGDSLVYSLVAPLKGYTNAARANDPNDPNYPYINRGPYPTIVWNYGYGLFNIMDGSPHLQINATTGEMTVRPTKEGFYQVAVKVEEYREGTKISEVIKDFPIWVSKKLTAGIAETELSSLELYPNPFQGGFYVEMDLLQSEVLIVEVLDVIGWQIYYKDFGKVSKGRIQKEINIAPSSPDHIYFVKITVGEKVVVKRAQQLK